MNIFKPKYAIVKKSGWFFIQEEYLGFFKRYLHSDLQKWTSIDYTYVMKTSKLEDAKKNWNSYIKKKKDQQDSEKIHIVEILNENT